MQKKRQILNKNSESASIVTTRLAASSKSKDKTRKSSRSKKLTVQGSKDSTFQNSHYGYLNFKKRETPGHGDDKKIDKFRHRPTVSLVPSSEFQPRIPAQVKNSLIISRDLSMVWKDKPYTDLSKVEDTISALSKGEKSIKQEEKDYAPRSMVMTRDLSLIKDQSDCSQRVEFSHLHTKPASVNDLQSLMLYQTLQAHRNSVTGLAVAETGFLVSSSLDHTLKVWSYFGSVLKRNPIFSIKDSSPLTALTTSSDLIIAGTKEGFVRVIPVNQVFKAAGMDQTARVRLHKAKILKVDFEQTSGSLYSLAQDHIFSKYDVTKASKKFGVDLKTGAIDFALNYRDGTAACAKINGTIAFYSTGDGRQLPLTIDLTERADSTLTAITWIGHNQLVAGLGDGSLLLYDVRKVSKPVTERPITSKVNKIMSLNSGKILALGTELHFFDSSLEHELSLALNTSDSSIYTATEDVVRNAIVVAGFDQKLYLVKPKAAY